MRFYVTAPVSEIDRGWQNLVKNVLIADLYEFLAFALRLLERFYVRWSCRGKIDVQLDVVDNKVKVSVADTGKGIPEEQRENLIIKNGNEPLDNAVWYCEARRAIFSLQQDTHGVIGIGLALRGEKLIQLSAKPDPGYRLESILVNGEPKDWQNYRVGEEEPLAFSACFVLAFPELSLQSSGTCGQNLRWTMYSDKTLLISGTGLMNNYSNTGSPWYYKSVVTAVIDPGATSIGNAAFYQASSLASVTIPDSVTSIGTNAFYYCYNLTTVTIPKNVTNIGTTAFRNCTALREIRFDGPAPSIGANAFQNVTATAYYPANDPSWTEEVRQNYGGTITWVPYEAAPAAVTVTFDAAGGSVSPESVEVSSGEAIGTLPTPEREGWVFLGWFTAPMESYVLAGQGTPVTAESVFEEDGTAYAHWRLPGDINGDGKLNNKDVTRLQKHLKGDEVEINVAALDVNGDGKVNNKDLTRLQKYLKGDEVEIH